MKLAFTFTIVPPELYHCGVGKPYYQTVVVDVPEVDRHLHKYMEDREMNRLVSITEVAEAEE